MKPTRRERVRRNGDVKKDVKKGEQEKGKGRALMARR